MTRTEHALPLPSLVPDVANMCAIVRDELHRAGRSAEDAEIRVGDGELLATYDTPRAAVVAVR
ncbi:hypothetical protein [Streptomyces chrestomyceticus]|uniref:Uncharacterized protein n=1 Tax=Streptomyces chrestomyceticus TaxID=68185 RepID=A0ABU7WTW4_9ACTN